MIRDIFPPPRGPKPVKRLLGKEYNRSKPVVIIGKGPSARFVPSSNDYYTCCLNQSGRMTDKIDFQFLGDHQVYQSMIKIPDYFSKISNMILPVEFNQDNPEKKRSLELIDPAHISHMNVYEHSLHFHPYPETDEVRVYTVISSGETAIAWLLDEGFRTFYTVGIDPYAPDNIRHHVFESNNEGVGKYPNIPGGMAISYNRMIQRVEQFSGASMGEFGD